MDTNLLDRRWRMIRRLVAVTIIGIAAVGVSATGGAESSPEVESGRQVFTANCAMCHGGDANGMMGMHPSLRGAIDRLSVEGVEVTVRNGRDTRPPMPAFEDRLSDQQIDEVIAYIGSLPPGPRNFGPESTAGEMMDGMSDGMMSGWMWLVPLLVLAALALGVGALVYSLRWRVSSRRRVTATTPREILDRRYAQGELTRDEYLQLRDDLGNP